MINRSIPKTLRGLLRTILLAGLLIAGMAQFSQLAAQSGSGATGAPPDEDVGAPPEFIPPPPPDIPLPPRPGSTGAVSRPVIRPNSPQSISPQVVDTDLLARPSNLVDDTDPLMQETVGLIRIPEMGTNEVLEMLENFTGKPILRQQTLPSVKITFFSQQALTRGEAITAIESLLALNGIAITSLGEKFLKAVPSAVINTQVPRAWEGSTLDATPSMMIYEKVFELDFLSTEEAATLIQPLMSQGAPIAFDKSNFILITDSMINLQRIERLLPIIDQPGRLRTEMLFFELQNLEAEDVVRRLQQLVTGALRNRLETNTTFEADDRTNQVIVFTHPANVELITTLIEKLDIDVAPTTSTKVYSIRYANATEVVDIIEQVVTGQRQVRSETGSENNPAAQAARARATQAVRANNQAAAAARAEASNLQFSDFLTIVPDERANTIVASGTHNDLAYLESLIEQIDSLLAQVRIEVIITEVSLSDDQVRGIESFGLKWEAPGGDSFNFNNPDSSWTLSPGDFYGLSFNNIFWGPNLSALDFILDAAKTNSNISVLSAPTIVTTHNKEATVSVGEERPVITGRTTYGQTGTINTGNNGNTFVSPNTQEQVQYRDIKLELKVKPLIGSDGVVQLEIDQSVQSVVDTISVGGYEQPVIGTRNATSYVSVRDGQLIALGGLQSLENTKTRNKMTFFGSIPIIGELFTRKNDVEIKRELLIFLRPTIIRTTEDADRDANQLIDNIQGTEDIRDYLNEGTFRRKKDKKEDEQEGEKQEVRRRYMPVID